MAKIIKLTPEYIDEIRLEFEELLSSSKLADGKISFTKSFGSINRKATVYFTDIAWRKQNALIKEFDKEVAWHGIAFRGEDPTKDEYTITDIMVYPQEVTGTNVETDQSKYQTWLMMHDDDVFNNIRMQGHSHVNMGTTPSGVDTSLYERILDQLDDTMFYIFLIYNKRGEKTYKIYDLAKNVLFETADVTVTVLDGSLNNTEVHVEELTDDENKALTACLAEYRAAKQLSGFLADAKTKVVNKVTQYQSPYPYGGYGGYGGYNKTPSTPASTPAPTPVSQPASTPKTIPISTPSAPAASSPNNKFAPVEVKKNSKSSVTDFSSFSGGKRRKGKRKDKNKDTKKNSKTGGYTQLSMSNASLYDDDDDLYGPYGYSDGYWD